MRSYDVYGTMLTRINELETRLNAIEQGVIPRIVQFLSEAEEKQSWDMISEFLDEFRDNNT